MRKLNRPPESVVEYIRRSIDDGKSYESVARAYGVSHTTIRKWLGTEAFSGLLSRVRSDAGSVRSVIHMDADMHEWVKGEAERLNCTQGLFIEYLLAYHRTKMAKLDYPVQRADLESYVQNSRNKESSQ